MTLTSGPDDEVPQADTPGDVFGKYRLIEKLGEGGMGVVWRAQQDHPIRRVVALKIVKAARVSGQVPLRFESERQALAILNHPNIATVFDAAATDDGRPYFVMEYVPGSPITQFADRHGLSIRARLELFLQVCEGVEHAHQKGLLHRDLKPGNILVASQDGRSVVKIIDFGIAKATGPQVTAGIVETHVGVLLGTPEYMSPEQASLTPEGVDTRTDIYSLGLVLYELLTGSLPFDVHSLRRRPVIEMLRVIREEEPPRLTVRLTGQSETALQEIAQRRLAQPRALVRQLRGDLEWITGRALEKEPARRYPSASELRADVQRHLSNEVVQAGPPSIAYRVHKFARRHRGIAAISIALVATIVTAAVLSTVLWIRSERARRDTRSQLVATLVAGGVARMDAWDWAGGLLSFVKALELEPDRARERDHRVRIGQVLQRMPRLVRLWAHGLRVKSVSVSAQGIVASAGTDGMVRLWSIQTGQQIGQPLRHDGAVNHVVFSPDGMWLASASDDGTAKIWSASDGAPVGQPLRHEKGVAEVAFSPDSQVIATAGADGWAKLWRLGSDMPYVQINLGAALLRVVFTRDGSRFAAAATEKDAHPFAVRVWSTKDGRPAGNWIRGQPGWTLHDMDLAPDGAHVVVGGYLGCFCARLWNASTGTPVGDPFVHRNAIVSARFNSTGAMVLSAGYDRVVQVWTVPMAQRAAPPWTIGGWPESVRFTADGQLLAATASGAVELVFPGSPAAYENFRRLPTFMHAGPVTSATLDGSGRFLVTSSSDGGVRVWDLAPALVTEAPFAWYGSRWGSPVIFAEGGRHLVSMQRIFDTTSGLPVIPPLRVDTDDFHVTVSRDSRLVATAGARQVRVWDATTGEPVSPVLNPRGELRIGNPLAFSADGRRLLTLSNADGIGDATVWDIATGARAMTLKHNGNVTAGAFSPDGTLLLTSSTERDVNLRIWRLDQQTLVFSGRHPEGVFSAMFAGPGRIVTVGFDQRVLEWRLESTLTSSEVLELHSEPRLLDIVGRTVIAGGRGGDVRARTIGSGAPTLTNLSQTGAVMSADVSPDGEWLVASGDDGRAQLWNLRSGERLSPLYQSSNPIEVVKFSPDGGTFAMSLAGVHVHELIPDARPGGLLNDLAELLSARRLVNTSDSPLRLEDLTVRWNRVSLAGAPEVRSVAPSWHRRQAAAALFRGNPALALDHLASLRTESRLSWTDTMIALAALARAGRWIEAGEEVQRLAARDAAPELIFVEAVAERHAGKPASPQISCRGLLTQYAATRNPDRALWILRICLLEPDAAEATWAATARLLDAVVNLRTYGTRESLEGAVAVRSGRFREAIDLLQRAIAAGERTPHTMLFLAMALARTHRPAEATKWLADSEKFTWPRTNAFSQMAFRDAWFEAEAVILRDEVRKLLER